MKGSGKPKFNRTIVNQNTGAFNQRSGKNGKFAGVNRNDKTALLAKLLKKDKQPNTEG